MAEKIVSPGVFTQEKDLSFLPTGIGQIGAALIGPTKKGPAFRPTRVTSYQEFIDIFGDLDSSTYLPYAAKAYLRSAGTATIIRIMGSEVWEQKGALNIFDSASKNVLATLLPVNESGGVVLTLSGSTSASGFALTCSLGPVVPLSFTSTSANYIGNYFSTSPATTGSGLSGNYYLYRFFPEAAHAAAVSGNLIDTSSYTMSFAGTNASFQNAKTPWITSQLSAGVSTNLFRIGRISDGTEGNYDVKVTIEDIRKAGTVPGTAYGAFNLYVRRIGGFLGSGDTDTKPEVLESFLNLDLDPRSENYLLKRIGDMYSTVDESGRVTMIGFYPNKSKYIYIITPNGFENIPAGLYPFGFRIPNSTIPTGSAGEIAFNSGSYVTRQGDATTYDNRIAFGFNFYSDDAKQLLYSIPNTALGQTARVTESLDFNLSNMKSHPTATTVYDTNGSLFPVNTLLDSGSAPVEMLKFAIPFQGGHDGLPYNRKKNVGANIAPSNVFGFNCESSTKSGSLAYIKALNVLSNADEYDINLIVTPGIISSKHSAVTDKAIQVCENRGDTFYIMDTVMLDDNISQAVANVGVFDTNYAATYYPWVKVQDSVSKKFVWVPPSVVVPGVFSQNDKLAYEWFAPAGLTRGGIPEATQVYFRLTQADRDQLYLNRINPISSFPNIGVCVWGQKTLQAKASALDRINVRRLLIATKKFIASATKYLVFEQNTTQTRNRFLNIVNPYLDSVKQRQGLYAFKAVMDDTNNTPDLIDRNIMYGQLFLQPTKTAEFIIIDFNIQATGASFSA